jgi:hypothetical protein
VGTVVLMDESVVTEEWSGAPGLWEIADRIANDAVGMYSSLAYYAREGTRISMRQADRLYEDPEYRVLRQTRVPGGEVGSFWIGVDSRDSEEKEAPLIYETTFLQDDDVASYVVSEVFATAEEALAFHEQLVGSVITSVLRTFASLGEIGGGLLKQGNGVSYETTDQRSGRSTSVLS